MDSATPTKVAMNVSSTELQHPDMNFMMVPCNMESKDYLPVSKKAKLDMKEPSEPTACAGSIKKSTVGIPGLDSQYVDDGADGADPNFPALHAQDKSRQEFYAAEEEPVMSSISSSIRCASKTVRADATPNLQDQAGTSLAALAAPLPAILEDKAGSEVDDSEEDDPGAMLLRTFKKAVNLGTPNVEYDPETVAVLDNVAIELDAAEDMIQTDGRDVFDWTSDYSTYKSTQEKFTGDAGPTHPHDTPYDNFTEIWDRPIMEHIADMTNLYVVQKVDHLVDKNKLTGGARINRWSPTCVDELYVYFAILMYMAIDLRGSIKEYWTRSALETVKYRQLMAYNRFIMLNSMLHFVDNEADLLTDVDPKVAKLQPIIEHCNRKFQSLYVLDQNIAIDESLTLWKGHLGRVTNNMTKAARFGIKIYELCESSTGYLWKFIIDTGKDISTSTSDFGKTSAIVLNLMQDLLHKGHCLTMDALFNSPVLARHLKSSGVDSVGMLRAARKNVPPTIKRLTKSSCDPGSVTAQHCGDVSVLAWNDAKLVVILSTFHNRDMCQGSRGGRPQTKPQVIKDYNSAMGGVDLKDQKLSMYIMERKRGIKWYIKMFKRLLNVSVLNSFIMYRRAIIDGRAARCHREYRYALAEQLCLRHSSRAVPALLTREPSRYDGLKHYAMPRTNRCKLCIVKGTESCRKCKKIRRACVHCYAMTKRVLLTWVECEKCKKFLHLGKCFKEYHTRQNN